MLKKIISKPLYLILMSGLVVGCASNKITQVKGFSAVEYDQQASLAQNTLKLVYFNRYVSDARLTKSDWQASYQDQDYFAKQASIRSSNLTKQLTRSASLDSTRPFDQPNIISWIEVDSLKGYGSPEFNQQVFESTSEYILESLDASIESDFEKSASMASVEFSGNTCEQIQTRLHPEKIKKGEWLGSEEDVTCFINYNHEIVRPVLPEDWRPKQIQFDPDKQYVVVRTRIANYEAFLYGQQLANSFVYFPPKRTTHKRGRSITTGKGTAFLLNGSDVYLFVRPDQGNEVKISQGLWATGNKMP